MSSSPQILILNGPNLNMLGQREPEIYGTVTLEQIERDCAEFASDMGMGIDFRQSNSEGDLVSWIQDSRTGADGIILNAAGYTHTSVAILDAIKSVALPVIEVHLSNTAQREVFRQTSYVAPGAKGTITGFGAYGYIMALDAMKNILDGN